MLIFQELPPSEFKGEEVTLLFTTQLANPALKVFVM